MCVRAGLMPHLFLGAVLFSFYMLHLSLYLYICLCADVCPMHAALFLSHRPHVWTSHTVNSSCMITLTHRPPGRSHCSAMIFITSFKWPKFHGLHILFTGYGLGAAGYLGAGLTDGYGAGKEIVKYCFSLKGPSIINTSYRIFIFC